MQHLDEKFEAEVIDENVDNGNEEITDYLRPAFQRGAREADVARHPKACEEGNGELEHEGRDVGRESNETKVDYLLVEDVIIKDIVQHPLQHEIQAAAGRIAEQFEAHYFAERRIEEVNELRQGTFYPGFYVLQG